VARQGDLQSWLSALRWELDVLEMEGYFRPAAVLDTVFVGGGTPSLLGPGAMEGLAEVLGPDRLRGAHLEWTAEANPESFSREVAEAWSSAGVNRISLGVQSFQEPVLRWLNRLHDAREPGSATRRARAAGIQNMSIDLIFGLPREVERDWGKDLEQALSLGVPHLSLYGLTVEKGTPLARLVEQGKVTFPDEESYREQYLEAHRRLTSEGYRHYEVSNFALPGFEARHNRVYWDLLPYIGLGNSAHSFGDGRRRWNLRDWGEYQRAHREGRRPWGGEERLTPEQRSLETIWLGLRTDRGVSESGLGPAARSLVQEWERRGLASRQGPSVKLTPTGWLLLDELSVALDELGGSRVSGDGLTLPPGVFDLSMS